MSKDKKTQNTDLLKQVYGNKKEYSYAQELIQTINDDYELREKDTLVTNGIPYSKAYEYNQRKAINYAPPKNPNDDREVSMGIPHEKIISFAATFLKYVWKRDVDVYNEQGNIIDGLGKVYDLSIEHSLNLEDFKKKIALIYWELFTQGNAFVFEDWVVRTTERPVAYKDGEEVTADTMDYTYEFLDGLTYPEKEKLIEQTRKAVSQVLDGRQVIFGNPETNDVQEQGRITLEFEYTKADAEALFGSLKRWKDVPKSKEDINTMVGEKTTIFDASRHKSPEDVYLVHMTMDKENNRLNWFVNGVMMLPRQTPLSIFYPRMNYPLTNFAAERLRGSIYARGIPAKVKFNADFIDWALKMLARKFEQGIDPALLSKGKYTLTRDMFRGGQVTHGVSSDDFEKADPDNTGVTQPEFSFVGLLKEIIETQTINPTSSGEIDAQATATAISMADARQIEKLGFILDSLVCGYVDLYMRRAETIESKYTIKQRETVVDGENVPVYQNFMVNVAGTQNSVVFDEAVGTSEFDVRGKQHELFKQSFKKKKAGKPTEYYLANPKTLREGKTRVVITVKPEKIKDSQLQMIQMWDEFQKLIEIFPNADREVMQKEYLGVSGRPDDMFKKQIAELDQQTPTGYNMGSFGKPTVKNALMQQNV